jgi:plastocyanin
VRATVCRLLLVVICACGTPRVAGDAAVRDAPARDDASAASDVLVDAASADAAFDAPPDAALVVTDAAPDAPPALIVLVACPVTSHATVITSGQSFSPQQTTITVGQIVRFEPSSSHDVVSGTQAAPTTTFRADGGVPRCYRFDEAGVFPFFCSIHPNMTGAITVVL